MRPRTGRDGYRNFHGLLATDGQMPQCVDNFVAVNRHEITRYPGERNLVWYMLEHEDNEMMRPYVVLPG